MVPMAPRSRRSRCAVWPRKCLHRELRRVRHFSYVLFETLAVALAGCTRPVGQQGRITRAIERAPRPGQIALPMLVQPIHHPIDVAMLTIELADLGCDDLQHFSED